MGLDSKTLRINSIQIWPGNPRLPDTVTSMTWSPDWNSYHKYLDIFIFNGIFSHFLRKAKKKTRFTPSWSKLCYHNITESMLNTTISKTRLKHVERNFFFLYLLNNKIANLYNGNGRKLNSCCNDLSQTKEHNTWT